MELNKNDIEWSKLSDAYGSAEDIPVIFEQAINLKPEKLELQSGPCFELWSRLRHQGSIYTASYAIGNRGCHH